MDVCGLNGKKLKEDGGAGSQEAPGQEGAVQVQGARNRQQATPLHLATTRHSFSRDQVTGQRCSCSLFLRRSPSQVRRHSTGEGLRL